MASKQSANLLPEYLKTDKNLKFIDLSMCIKIKTLDSYMFAESGLERILLPPYLERIGYQCFHNCPL